MLTAVEFKKLAMHSMDAGPSLFHRSALSIRDGGGVLEHVFANGKYKRVLEIGTYRGISTAFIAQFVDKVTTIDLKFGKIEINRESWSRSKFWKAMGVENKIDLILVTDNYEKRIAIEHTEFDIAFIDGGKNDIVEDFNNCKHCGAVLFHDVDERPGGPQFNYVYDFVMSLPKEQVTRLDIFALWRA